MNLGASLCEFILDRQSLGLAKASIRFYRTHVGAFVAFLVEQGCERVEGVDRHLLRAFFAHLNERAERSEIAPATVAAYERAVRTFCRFCFAEGWLPRDPMRGRRRAKVPRSLPDTWSIDEVRALLATCDPSPAGLRDRAIMVLLLDTGLRAGEVVALTPGCLTLGDDRGCVRVRAEWTKSAVGRTVPLYTDTVDALRAWLNVRPEGARTVFVALDGHRVPTDQPLTVSGLNQALRARVERAGVPVKAKLCHIWRHTFARLYVQGGGDLETLRRLLGHQSLETTQVYLGFRDDEIADRHFELSPVRRLARGDPPGRAADQDQRLNG